jgi:transposase
MSKYDEGFKKRVVDVYLAREGRYAFLAKRFGVRSKTNIRKWFGAFKQFGEEGLLSKKTDITYPVQLKVLRLQINNSKYCDTR